MRRSRQGKLLSRSKRTIPYIYVDESQNEPFDEELQLASLYVLADARRGVDPLSAASLLYYPIQIRRRDGGAILIDMLGLNQTSFKFNQIPRVEGFNRELDSASEDPDAFLKVLRRRGSHFKDFTGHRTVAIKGILSKPQKVEEIQDLLEKSVEFDRESSTVFNTVLRESDVEAAFQRLDSLRRSIQKDEISLEGAKQRLEDAHGIAEKVLEEEIQNTKDSSSKVEARLTRTLRKKRDRLKKRLDREVAKLREAYRKQTKPLREERTKRKRRTTRLEKRIERLRSAGAREDVEAQKAVLDEMMAKYREMDEAVKTLEARRDGEVREAQERSSTELKVEEEKIRELREQSKSQIQKKLDLGSRIEEEAKKITRQIDALIRKKRNRLRSLSRIQLELGVEDTELYIPFYVFQYGEKRFDFHPPVAVAGSTGLFNRFRRMLAEGPESKMGMLIRPRGLFAEKHMDKAVKTLGRDTPTGRMYLKEAESLNLLRKRVAVDLMMTGLVKMRRQGWISDGEYIRLQEGLVERLGTVTQP
jgi:hypothetical protein